jgi:Ca2+:H+ antiporter
MPPHAALSSPDEPEISFLKIMLLVRQEAFLLVALSFILLAYLFEHTLLESGQTISLAAAAALIGVIVLASTRVAHHAEVLAHKVGDPYGTMILTLSAVAVEVLILAIMMGSSNSPTLVRDTIYSAVMLDINGILGLAALLGGLRHGEQPYNDDSSRTYSAMILTAMGISMIVPEFIPEAKWHYYSAFTIFAMIALYALFLRMQVGTHSYFFNYSYNRVPRSAQPSSASPAMQHAAAAPAQPVAPASEPAAHQEAESESATLSIAVILIGVLIIGFLAEFMSAFLNTGLEGTGAPPALMAVVVAAISAAPEILTALRAALRNRMQSVVNIAMGASLSTVILTVPVMEGIALYTGQPFIMAMTPVQTVMVAITLVVAAINLNDGQTNAIEGMTHFVLFATFVMLTLLGL